MFLPATTFSVSSDCFRLCLACSGVGGEDLVPYLDGADGDGLAGGEQDLGGGGEAQLAGQAGGVFQAAAAFFCGKEVTTRRVALLVLSVRTVRPHSQRIS
jgi:hypothetical protein